MSLDVWLTKEVTEVRSVFDFNVTHNLSDMAEEARIYKHLWRPEEIGKEKAGELVYSLECALEDLLIRPDHYKQFNPENGWGTYERFVEVVTTYLEACKQHPDADIHISR